LTPNGGSSSTRWPSRRRARGARNASWTRPDWPPKANGELVSALDGNWPEVSKIVEKKIEAKAQPAGIGPEELRQATLDSVRAIMMIRAYRMRGHLHADLDPIGVSKKLDHEELHPASYGFTEADMDRPIFIDHVLGLEYATVRQMIDIRRTTAAPSATSSCTSPRPRRRPGVQERIEGPDKQIEFTDNGKKAILNKLIEAEGFEKFLDVKYTGTKRFGLDGGESLIPALEQIIKRAATSA
jgi:2-oxoglutarate dehydrogenase E1 component (EC 1.2.4.2)